MPRPLNSTEVDQTAMYSLTGSELATLCNLAEALDNEKLATFASALDNVIYRIATRGGRTPKP